MRTVFLRSQPNEDNDKPNKRPFSRKTEQSKAAAIAAIKGYQQRLLTNSELEEEVRMLLQHGHSSNPYDYHTAAFDYQSLIMDLLVLITDPNNLMKLNPMHHDDAGMKLRALADFFSSLKDNHTVKAALDLYDLERHSSHDSEELIAIAKRYRHATELCKAESICVVE